jgi:hypothetical protein
VVEGPIPLSATLTKCTCGADVVLGVHLKRNNTHANAHRPVPASFQACPGTAHKREQVWPHLQVRCHTGMARFW